ncbi:MAG: nuclear transport factor 2 family protein [Acidobacteriota bacterium]
MKRLFLFTTWVMLCSIWGFSQGNVKKTTQPKAHKEIRHVLDEQVKAWNQKDLERFMAGYWNSEKLSFYSGGTRTFSWQTTIERYRKRYQGEGNEMGTLEFSDIIIETLGIDSAFVRGHWQLKMKTGEPGGLFTLIFRKFPNGWKIIHDHTSSN